MADEWGELFEQLTRDFIALKRDDPNFPSIADPLDHDVEQLLQHAQANPSQVDPHHVEELLTDCVDRIANCLTLREKAAQVEVAAIAAATEYKERASRVETERAIRNALSTLRPILGGNATGTRISANQTENTGDASVWARVNGAEEDHEKAILVLLQTLLTKAQAPGNGSNYVERFAFLKRLFDQSLIEAYRRARVCEKALSQIYDIHEALPQLRSTGYLNELAIWGQKVADLLDEKLDQRVVAEVAFTLGAKDNKLREHEIVGKSDFYRMLRADRRIRFTMTETHFEKYGMKNPLLRSLNVQARLAQTLWPIKVTIPSSQVTGKKAMVPSVAETGNYFTNDTIIIEPIHNRSPIGDWEIEVNERSLYTQIANPDKIKSFFLRMRLTYEPVS